jgi:hypothetical protein
VEEHRAFVTFAGLWAEAMWTCQDEDADFYDAMYVARISNGQGDTAKYESRVEELAARFGSDPDERAWEAQWHDQLQPLWPAVCEVAAMLVNGQLVTHEDVLAAVNRCRAN